MSKNLMIIFSPSPLRLSVYLLSLTLLLSVGCKSSQSASEIPSSATELTLTTLDQGGYCAVEEASQLWITDQAVFRELWTQMHSNQMPSPDLPDIDFDTHGVVAAFMGTRASGGYRISLEKAAKHNDTAYFVVKTTSPGPACLVTNALTYPFVMAVIDRSGIEEAVFIETAEVSSCDS